MNLLGSYVNGNYRCTIFEDGTKVRSNNLDSLIPHTAESIDLKITNRCDKGCAYCHEKSFSCGKHADLISPSFLDTLHPYTEIAIGGGNPLSHPQLVWFLEKLQKLNCIPSITINQTHFELDYELIKLLADRKLIYGIGISFESYSDEFINKVKLLPNAVVHVINGVVSINNLEKLAEAGIKVLILGYKHFGKGFNYYSQVSADIKEKQELLKDKLAELIPQFDVISFDNLAIDQLKLKDLLSEEEWNNFYMGDDGQYTFYVDMVNRQYAKNSCSNDRYPIRNTLEEMFSSINKSSTLTQEELNEIFIENYSV